jgi:hypothetical protein
MILSTLKTGFISLGLILSTAIHAYANRMELEYLGQTNVQSIFSDSDIVEFGPCDGRRNDFIQYIQLRVDREPVEIEDLVIEYGNGQRDRLQVREHFEPGTASRLIDLNGHNRCVTRAFVRARTLSYFNEGVVSFYGYRQRHNQPDPIHGRFAIGRTNLDYSRDAEQLFVSRCDRNDSVIARQLQIHVVGNDANIEEFVVTFGNGDVINIPVREYFAQGSWSQVKDLPGDQRCIREIFVLGRTLSNRYNGGRATVDVFGIH